MRMIGMPEITVVALLAAMALAVIWPAATICRRLGFSPVLGLLAPIPIANVLLLWFVAFSRWPRVDTKPSGV